MRREERYSGQREQCVVPRGQSELRCCSLSVAQGPAAGVGEEGGQQALAESDRVTPRI